MPAEVVKRAERDTGDSPSGEKKGPGMLFGGRAPQPQSPQPGAATGGGFLFGGSGGGTQTTPQRATVQGGGANGGGFLFGGPAADPTRTSTGGGGDIPVAAIETEGTTPGAGDESVAPTVTKPIVGAPKVDEGQKVMSTTVSKPKTGVEGSGTPFGAIKLTASATDGGGAGIFGKPTPSAVGATPSTDTGMTKHVKRVKKRKKDDLQELMMMKFGRERNVKKVNSGWRATHWIGASVETILPEQVIRRFDGHEPTVVVDMTSINVPLHLLKKTDRLKQLSCRKITEKDTIADIFSLFDHAAFVHTWLIRSRSPEHGAQRHTRKLCSVLHSLIDEWIAPVSTELPAEWRRARSEKPCEGGSWRLTSLRRRQMRLDRLVDRGELGERGEQTSDRFMEDVRSETMLMNEYASSQALSVTPLFPGDREETYRGEKVIETWYVGREELRTMRQFVCLAYKRLREWCVAALSRKYIDDITPGESERRLGRRWIGAETRLESYMMILEISGDACVYFGDYGQALRVLREYCDRCFSLWCSIKTTSDSVSTTIRQGGRRKGRRGAGGDFAQRAMEFVAHRRGKQNAAPETGDGHVDAQASHDAMTAKVDERDVVPYDPEALEEYAEVHDNLLPRDIPQLARWAEMLAIVVSLNVTVNSSIRRAGLAGDLVFKSLHGSPVSQVAGLLCKYPSVIASAPVVQWAVKVATAWCSGRARDVLNLIMASMGVSCRPSKQTATGGLATIPLGVRCVWAHYLPCARFYAIRLLCSSSVRMQKALGGATASTVVATLAGYGADVVRCGRHLPPLHDRHHDMGDEEDFFAEFDDVPTDYVLLQKALAADFGAKSPLLTCHLSGKTVNTVSGDGMHWSFVRDVRPILQQ